MEKENTIKTNDKKNIIIIVLTTIIICLLLFICYDKLFKSDEKSNNTNKENTQEETKNNENNKENDETKEITVDELNLLTEKSNNYVEYYSFQEILPITNISSIDNQVLLNYAVIELNFKETITAQEVEKIIRDFVGSGYTLKHQDIKCDSDEEQPLYTYDSNTKTYIENSYHDGHGGNGRYAYTKYIGSYKSNNNYILNFKIVYSNNISDEGVAYQYYTNVNDSNNGENILYEFDDYGDMNDEIFKTFEEKVPTTTFTYEKNSDGTFNLKSITIK